MRYMDAITKHMLNIKSIGISAFFIIILFTGITPSYLDAATTNTRHQAVSEIESKSLETSEKIEDTGKAPVFRMSLVELLEMEIVTASKVPEQLAKTISSVSVITADDLRRMGARTIYDALRHLPGISVGIGNVGTNFISVRGIYTASSEKILIMLNSHMLNDVRFGSATSQFLDNLPVENIQRIEVVKGPGSALYGANAFLGVINIITKRPDEINGVELYVNTEFESGNSIGQGYNFLYGNKFQNDLGFTFNANIIDHSGPDLNVEADVFGRSGQANTKDEHVDIQTSLDKGQLSIKGRYLNREAGDYFGIVNVLGGNSKQAVQSGFIEARIESDITNNLQLTFISYIDHQKTNNYYEAYPAGSIPSGHPFSGWNSTGLIGNSRAKETSYGGEVKLLQREIKGHTVIWGISGRHEKLYDVKFFANSNPYFLPEVQDVSDEFNWIDNADRNIWAVYIQDIWDITDDIRLLAGARDDYYSDFGNTLNPRIGLSWDIPELFDIKLSYGTAFRAPDFYSQFVKNNLVAQGNNDLKPEKIQTFEASMGVELNERLLIRTTLFHNKLNDLIDKAPGSIMFDNLGNVTSNGIEIEARSNLKMGGYIMANYSYTDSKYDNGDPFPRVPLHSGSVLLDLPLSRYFSWNLNAYWQNDSSRDRLDTRSKMDGYIVVNTTLLAKKIRKDLELRFSVFNIFDKDYTYPSAPKSIPGDYPAQGRSFVLYAKYGF